MCWSILIRVCGFEDMPASASMWRVWRGCWCANVPSVLRIWNVVAGGVVLIKSDFFLQIKYALSRWNVYGKCSLCNLPCGDSD